MGKRSVKEDKNIYFKAREDAGLTRAMAAEKTNISESRIEKIENRNASAHPDEVLAMADAYNSASLCNYFCSHECPIGLQYVPEVQARHLSEAVLEMLASLNELDEHKNRLIAITADGAIDQTELHDLAKIESELDRVSMAIDSFKLWIDEKIQAGVINKDALDRERDSL